MCTAIVTLHYDREMIPNSSRMVHILHSAIDRGLYELGHGTHVVNLQVKSSPQPRAKRVKKEQ